ncbi:uncharacterized protein RAG0_02618 [Rhynchosporium agropyri]|uniref:Uncharacterized protein n=1 Tax=Rhynchosporium agropyri TaxID=914238 RepID=A0A1E1K1X0_9HELO|nr:uncharacterized protein RAG0_02618 [Rhynchosporium agropyri]
MSARNSFRLSLERRSLLPCLYLLPRYQRSVFGQPNPRSALPSSPISSTIALHPSLIPDLRHTHDKEMSQPDGRDPVSSKRSVLSHPNLPSPFNLHKVHSWTMALRKSWREYALRILYFLGYAQPEEQPVRSNSSGSSGLASMAGISAGMQQERGPVEENMAPHMVRRELEIYDSARTVGSDVGTPRESLNLNLKLEIADPLKSQSHAPARIAVCVRPIASELVRGKDARLVLSPERLLLTRAYGASWRGYTCLWE